MKLIAHFFYSLAVTVLVSGCTSPVAAVGSAAIQLMGLTKPETPEDQKPPRKIPLQIEAGINLNGDEKRRAQAIVIRLYHLKDANAFWLAPYDTFINPDRDKVALGNNLVSMQEITLAPGQSYKVTEQVARQAKYIGVVALFYSPNPHRWRIAFDTEKSEKEGILIGVHSCALTATRGSIQGSQAPVKNTQTTLWNSLLSVNCPASAT